jgi:hypothetical protein
LNTLGATILLRQSPDWAALDYRYLESLTGFERGAGLPLGFVRQLVMTWDGFFAVPYFQVRQQLKDLTLRSLSRVSNARLLPFAGCDLDQLSSRIYLFTDDDDWFDPDIVDRLSVHDRRGVQGMVWHSVRLAGQLEVRRLRHCFTNNYCVTSAFTEAAGEDLRLGMQRVMQHYDANRVFSSDAFESLYIEEPLSIANKHPCSPARLFNEYGPSITVDVLRADVQRFVAGLGTIRMPTDLAWASPLVQEVAEIFSAALP